jgi:ankyrin repeat protein
MANVANLNDAIIARDINAVRSALVTIETLETPDNVGWTPLFYGVASGRHEIVELLLDAGANPHRVDVASWTPKMHAISDQHAKIVDILDSFEKLH